MLRLTEIVLGSPRSNESTSEGERTPRTPRRSSGSSILRRSRTNDSELQRSKSCGNMMKVVRFGEAYEATQEIDFWRTHRSGPFICGICKHEVEEAFFESLEGCACYSCINQRGSLRTRICFECKCKTSHHE